MTNDTRLPQTIDALSAEIARLRKEIDQRYKEEVDRERFIAMLHSQLAERDQEIAKLREELASCTELSWSRADELRQLKYTIRVQDDRTLTRLDARLTLLSQLVESFRADANPRIAALERKLDAIAEALAVPEETPPDE